MHSLGSIVVAVECARQSVQARGYRIGGVELSLLQTKPGEPRAFEGAIAEEACRTFLKEAGRVVTVCWRSSLV